ncbi:MAG: hypothetical protein JNK47_14165 [Mesorhizobium sp.]|nr:hypothetical protein [Mesorhizobium sp.]MBL8578365.1 hypothetical protein [Mesorhizobium sp.]
MKLRVEEATWEEVFIDMVRIPADYRKHPDGTRIKNGSIVRIGHNGKKVFVLARGMRDRDSERVIYMDAFTRDALGVEAGRDEIDSVDIRAASWHEHLCWYLRASNPAVRVPAYIAAGSVVLGIISVALGVWSVCLSWRS